MVTLATFSTREFLAGHATCVDTYFMCVMGWKCISVDDGCVLGRHSTDRANRGTARVGLHTARDNNLQSQIARRRFEDLMQCARYHTAIMCDN